VELARGLGRNSRSLGSGVVTFLVTAAFGVTAATLVVVVARGVVVGGCVGGVVDGRGAVVVVVVGTVGVGVVVVVVSVGATDSCSGGTTAIEGSGGRVTGAGVVYRGQGGICFSQDPFRAPLE
jgi:hypothetical protein